jgi:hypothetical protein
VASLVTPVAELDDADELALAQAAPVSPAIPVEFVVDKAKTTAKKEQKEDEEPEADHLLEASPDTDEGPPLSHSSDYPLVHNSLDGITPLVMFSRFGESVKVTSGIDLNGFAPELTDSEESTSLSGFLIRPSSSITVLLPVLMMRQCSRVIWQRRLTRRAPTPFWRRISVIPTWMVLMRA